MTLKDMFNLNDDTTTQKVQKVVDAFDEQFGIADGPTQMEMVVAIAAILANRKALLIFSEDKMDAAVLPLARFHAIATVSDRLQNMMLSLLASDSLAGFLKSRSNNPRR